MSRGRVLVCIPLPASQRVGAVSFLNPLLLFGLLGVAAPIVIHLLAKKRVKRVVWAAMRFLKVTVQRNQRRMTLEDILLLLMRCALVMALAFALARPTLKRSGLAVFGGSETAFILLDNSGSMSASDGVESRFEKARKAADQVVDSLPAGSSVAVWLMSDTVKQLLPAPTQDLAMARKLIRDAKRSDQATDVPAAVRLAIEAAQRLDASQKQLYLVGDAQASGWRGAGATRALLEPIGKEIATRIILVGDSEERNVAVTGIRQGSALATVNQPLRFDAMVANFGSTPAENVAVSIAINDEPPSDEQTVERLPGGGEAQGVSLFATFREPGFHTVTVRVAGDRCPFDDARTFALRVIDEIHVLLVDGQPGGEPRDSEVFYLRNALTPVPLEMRGQFFIKTKTIAAAELESVALAEHDAVIMANVVDLSAPALHALEEYVRGGGGLLVFPGDRINEAFYNDKMHAESGLLPAAFAQPRGEIAPPDKQQAFFHLQSSYYKHRITEPWRDPKSGSLGTAQFYKAFTLLPPKASDVPGGTARGVEVVNFDNGAPAILEKPFGNGRVIQFASTASTRWNDLPVRPVFLPLVHRILGYILSRDEDRLNTRAGAAFHYELKPALANRRHVITTPDGTILAGASASITTAETSFAGAYHVSFPDDDERPVRFAVYSDPAESDLRNMPATDLKTLESVAQVIPWAPGVDLKKTLQTERSGTELWRWVALLALALAVAETLLGNRWSRSK
jgi:hypothetical protein